MTAWMLALIIKIFVIFALFVTARLIAWVFWKVLPDSSWKRALFATHGNVRRRWASYASDMRRDRPNRRPALLSGKRSD